MEAWKENKREFCEFILLFLIYSHTAPPTETLQNNVLTLKYVQNAPPPLMILTRWFPGLMFEGTLQRKLNLNWWTQIRHIRLAGYYTTPYRLFSIFVSRYKGLYIFNTSTEGACPHFPKGMFFFLLC